MFYRDFSRLNQASRIVFNFFYLYIAQRPALTFADEIESVMITSQYREGPGTRHSTDRACDLVVRPLWLNPVFFIIMHSYLILNIFLSLIPRTAGGRYGLSLHCDCAFNDFSEPERNFRNRKYLEVLNTARPGWIRLINPEVSYTERVCELYGVDESGVRGFIRSQLPRLVGEGRKVMLPSSPYGNIVIEETKQAARDAARDVADVFGGGVRWLFVIAGLGAGLWLLTKLLPGDEHVEEKDFSA